MNQIDNKLLCTLCEDCHNQVERLKDDCDYEFLRILKSDNWKSGKKIMFSGYPGNLSIEIYDKQNEYVTGFNIGYDQVKQIMKLCRYVTKY